MKRTSQLIALAATLCLVTACEPDISGGTPEAGQRGAEGKGSTGGTTSWSEEDKKKEDPPPPPPSSPSAPDEPGDKPQPTARKGD